MRRLFRNILTTVALSVTVSVLIVRLAFARQLPPELADEWSCEDSWAARDYERYILATRTTRR